MNYPSAPTPPPSISSTSCISRALLSDSSRSSVSLSPMCKDTMRPVVRESLPLPDPDLLDRAVDHRHRLRARPTHAGARGGRVSPYCGVVDYSLCQGTEVFVAPRTSPQSGYLVVVVRTLAGQNVIAHVDARLDSLAARIDNLEQRVDTRFDASRNASTSSSTPNGRSSAFSPSRSSGSSALTSSPSMITRWHHHHLGLCRYCPIANKPAHCESSARSANLDARRASPGRSNARTD